MLNKGTLIGFILVSFIMNGCVSNVSKQISIQNETLEKQKMPIRLYKDVSIQNTDFYKSDWAGKKGKSIALNSTLVYTDVLKIFKHNCGFNQSDLIETRIVSHKSPIFYEVWVFKDNMSKREDKTSGLSVLLTQLPNNRGIDMNFHGKCHSDEPLQFIIEK